MSNAFSIFSVAPSIDNSDAGISILSILDKASSFPQTCTLAGSLEQLGNRTIEFMVASIKQNYLAKNLQVSYEPDAEVTLVFQGEKDTLDSLDISKAVSVNLQNYTKEGTYDIPVEVDLPDGVTLTKPVTVQLILTEKGSTKDEQPENNAGTN